MHVPQFTVMGLTTEVTDTSVHSVGQVEIIIGYKIIHFYDLSSGYGFVDYQGPHYGSGYDKYVFGSYEGHAVNIFRCREKSEFINFFLIFSLGKYRDTMTTTGS